jgi:predicted YcjX-like family ATPase
MNDFEWRRQLRELRQPQAPRRDLWADIERTLESTAPAGATVTRRVAGSHTAWLFAAGLAAVTVLAVGLTRLAPPGAPASSTTLASMPVWKPDDPRLAGAAVELTAAQYELRQAIQQSPNSAALQRLLNRTELQESRLRQLGHDAG